MSSLVLEQLLLFFSSESTELRDGLEFAGSGDIDGRGTGWRAAACAEVLNHRGPLGLNV